MRMMPLGSRRAAAVVVAMIMLSVLWGDTQDGSAAGVIPRGQAASASPSNWALLNAIPSEGRVAPSSGPHVTMSSRAQMELENQLRATAGIPPWAIWPPSPMPRVAGTIVRRLTVNALAALHPAAIQARWTPPSILPSVTAGENSWLDLRVPRPPARLVGADYSVPRPPPSALRP